ncbi:hypothetical protein ACFXDJ_24535 [Streptomyces sp. NPDC059443]|uniref:hypothetical protein n=1 Tax=unclassified Streptomyces TaxID=2593676 RepID=UPI003678978A
MYAFTHFETHSALHATRTAEATAWRLGRTAALAAPAAPSALSAPSAPALRDRVGEALIGAGIRLIRPAHLHARITRIPHPYPYGGTA